MMIYEEINDIFNSSMPATTKIGQGIGIGTGVFEEIKGFYENINDKETNND